jgi:hypothetical protein
MLISTPFSFFLLQSFRFISLSMLLCLHFFFSSLIFSSTSLYNICIPTLFVYTVAMSNVKMQVWLPVVSNEDCGRIYREKSISIGNGQLCAGGIEGKDSCNGDSGGPLMSTGISPRDGKTRYFMAGVMSFVLPTCGTKDWPGVYTRVSQYTDWILNQLAE